MADYAEAAIRAAEAVERPFTLVGWSMGGLVAMMAAGRIEPTRLVLIEPSPPAEVQGFHEEVPLVPGAFDPEDVYGRFPVRARPESTLARAERKRGISVASLPCPTLVVTGDDFREERGAVAKCYGAELLDLPGLDHWELVLGKETARRIVSWAGCSTGITTDSGRPSPCARSAAIPSERSPRGNGASRSSG